MLFLPTPFPGVCSAMSLSPTRSRSPRNTGSVRDDKSEEPKENPEALTQVGHTGQDVLPEAPAEGEKQDVKDDNEGPSDHTC